MKTKHKIIWLLENCVDENEDVNLRSLYCSDFDCDVHINPIIVKKNLYQDSQYVEGSLLQDFQKVKGKIYQDKLEKTIKKGKRRK